MDEIEHFRALGFSSDSIWKGVLVRIAASILGRPFGGLQETISRVQDDPRVYSSVLSEADSLLARQQRHLLIVFDALDRLGRDWERIRELSGSLLRLAVGLQSFKAIRAKVFMRVDQLSDRELFKFPDSSKIRNDHVSLVWQAGELYGLLLFEILRDSDANEALHAIAGSLGIRDDSLRDGGGQPDLEAQRALIEAIAGEFMGSNRKRGLVYTWVPLHLSDAANACSPRTFLTAWKKAAEHKTKVDSLAVDHLGLLDGVRSASRSRLSELYEDYAWIRPSLEALQKHFVPLSKEQLFGVWRNQGVVDEIKSSSDEAARIPVGLTEGDEEENLLEAMKTVAVMDERSNGKINVPDIFRVEAGILRKGGVAVPKRQ